MAAQGIEREGVVRDTQSGAGLLNLHFIFTDCILKIEWEEKSLNKQELKQTSKSLAESEFTIRCQILGSVD